MEKALKGLNLALGQQAWGHTLTRLWVVLPQQDWQPPPPEGLEDRLRQTAERAGPPSCPFHQ